MNVAAFPVLKKSERKFEIAGSRERFVNKIKCLLRFDVCESKVLISDMNYGISRRDEK